MKVFTLGYFPFVMGGRTWQEICIEVENADGPHDIGKGYQAYVITAPNGKTFVAEATSGAFVGPDLKTVRDDIKLGEQETMDKQVAQAVEQSKLAKTLTPEEFWRMLKCNTDQ
jgi:hypothetical protein